MPVQAQIPATVGNVLGATRAEADAEMLAHAFVETADFAALTATRDFNFVVGRRGTGKTALFLRVSDYFRADRRIFLHSDTPAEYAMLALQSALGSFGQDYRTLRPLARVLWRARILLTALSSLLGYWKIHRADDHDVLAHLRDAHADFLELPGPLMCTELLKRFVPPGTPAAQAPALIASGFQIEKLQEAIHHALASMDREFVILLDGLDEGWAPTEPATAVLGGLMMALSSLRDVGSSIHGILFLRDNIFRSIAHFDADYSRHIEGNTLRLRWDEAALLHLIANRVRFRLKLESTVGDIKAWNRFAQRELGDREGFRRCLNHTLYRPRDLLVLLNQAAIVASRAARQHIIDADIAATAKEISQDRLADLLKEYDTVLPGLDLFTKRFAHQPALSTVHVLVAYLDGAVASEAYDTRAAGDFALLGTGAEVLLALYGVGFIGMEDAATGRFAFCHDGAPSTLDLSVPTARTIIHPCYWQALDIAVGELQMNDVVEIFDDPDETRIAAVESRDLRVRHIGQIVEQLPNLPLGDDGAKQFEEWVFRAVRILFPGALCNPELKPNGDAVQRRDIVATNMATTGFWKRVLEDFHARQVIVEVKNYETLGPDDFRQAVSYTGGAYGKFVMVITRAQSEGATVVERGWILEMFQQHQCLVFTMPAELMARCLRKLRNAQKFVYVEKVMGRRLDTFQRSYLSTRHARK